MLGCNFMQKIVGHYWKGINQESCTSLDVYFRLLGREDSEENGGEMTRGLSDLDSGRDEMLLEGFAQGNIWPKF